MQFYSQDVFIENITPRKKSAMGTGLFILCIVMALLTFVFGLVFLPSMLACAAFLGLGYYLKTHDSIDFEGDYTNGVLDMAVIYNKQSRKAIVSIDMENLVVMAPSDSDALAAYAGRKMRYYDCTSHEPGVPHYCLVFKNPANANEEEKLLFEPSPELLDAIWSRHPREVHK